MTRPHNPYKRLPFKGRKVGFARRESARIYLAEDHVLQILEHNYSENARRFYFRDIQMLSYAENDNWIIAGTIFGIFGLLFGFVAAWFAFLFAPTLDFDGADIVFGAFFGVFALIALLVALLHFLRGPTCRFFINTAVQEVEIVAVRRVRKAMQLADILRPRIAAAQQELAQAIPEPRSDAPMEIVTPSNFAGVRYIMPVTTPQEKKPFSPRVHVFAYLLGLGMGISWLADFMYRSELKNRFDTLVYFVAVVVILAALIQQHRTRSPRDVQWLTWLLACCLAVFFVWSTIFGMVLAMENPEIMQQIDPFGTNEALETPAFRNMVVIMSGILLLLSTVGLARLARIGRTAPARRTSVTEEPAPAPEAPYE